MYVDPLLLGGLVLLSVMGLVQAIWLLWAANRSSDEPSLGTPSWAKSSTAHPDAPEGFRWVLVPISSLPEAAAAKQRSDP